MTDPVHEPPPLTVLYDGACPLCRREIGGMQLARPENAIVPTSPVERGACQLRSLLDNVGSLIRGTSDGRCPQLLLAEAAYSPAHN